MATTQPLPPITPRTLAVVQDLMKRDGLDSSDSEQVSLYVERLIARERFFRTVADVRKKMESVPEEELQRMIDEAVQEVEAEHRGQAAGAAPTGQ
jgi:hypothetical protein